jgi:HAD superfamily hydrolase (TIGR01509 family)
LKKVKCIIFDCDGTLVDSEPLTNKVIAEMAEELGVKMTWKEATKLWGGKTIDAVVYGMKELSGNDLPEDWVPRLVQKVSDAYKYDLVPMEGISEVLDSLKISTCVASNGRPGHVENSLKITGLYKYFEGRVYTASEVAYPKPAPDLFLYAVDKMGFSKEECVVIEDSIPGVTASVRAGIRVFGLVKMSSEKELTEAGAEPFTNMRELPNLLGL